MPQPSQRNSAAQSVVVQAELHESVLPCVNVILRYGTSELIVIEICQAERRVRFQVRGEWTREGVMGGVEIVETAQTHGGEGSSEGVLVQVQEPWMEGQVGRVGGIIGGDRKKKGVVRGIGASHTAIFKRFVQEYERQKNTHSAVSGCPSSFLAMSPPIDCSPDIVSPDSSACQCRSPRLP